MICFYVHKGNQPYYLCSLKHTLSHCPKLNIIAIGDCELKRSSGIFTVACNQLESERYNLFQQNYLHLSPNFEKYERFCFSRWFYIEAYMKNNGIDQAMHIDSDVLLNKEPAYTGKYAYCFDSGHTSVFSFEDINGLCSLILESYLSSKSINRLKELYKYKMDKYRAGISDMDFVTMYANSVSGSINLSNCSELGYVYDHNVNASDGMKMHTNKKVIVYNDGRYYFIKNSGELVEARSIHFQGNSKLYMASVSSSPNSERFRYFDYNTSSWNDSIGNDKSSAYMKINEQLYRVKKRIISSTFLNR